jgi:hypothetical protein
MRENPGLYSRYPVKSVLTYNGTTVLHFLLGGWGLVVGYPHWWGYLLSAAYLVFAFAEMYILMPLKVCPNCPYYKLNNSLCVSGLNLLSRKIAREGTIKAFSNRAKGLLCPNYLYIASLVIPILAIIPALALKFSWLELLILVLLVILLLFRFFVIFPKIACVFCRAQNVCPQAQSMGFGNKKPSG